MLLPFLRLCLYAVATLRPCLYAITTLGCFCYCYFSMKTSRCPSTSISLLHFLPTVHGPAFLATNRASNLSRANAAANPRFKQQGSSVVQIKGAGTKASGEYKKSDNVHFGSPVYVKADDPDTLLWVAVEGDGNWHISDAVYYNKQTGGKILPSSDGE